jgi:hypothetical protein
VLIWEPLKDWDRKVDSLPGADRDEAFGLVFTGHFESHRADFERQSEQSGCRKSQVLERVSPPQGLFADHKMLEMIFSLMVVDLR